MRKFFIEKSFYVTEFDSNNKGQVIQMDENLRK